MKVTFANSVCLLCFSTMQPSLSLGTSGLVFPRQFFAFLTFCPPQSWNVEEGLSKSLQY